MLDRETLTAMDFEEKFYAEHKAAGLDYLHCGYWHTSYAIMLAEAAAQHAYKMPAVLDAGCACGALVEGFWRTGLFARYRGIDISRHMIELGHKERRPWLDVGGLEAMPYDSDTFSLVHCAQTLEHIDESRTGFIVREFARVLQPGGKLFVTVPAIKLGQVAEIHQNDPTHVNIKPPTYWTDVLQQFGLVWDAEFYERFARSAMKAGPHLRPDQTWFLDNTGWSVFTLYKR